MPNILYVKRNFYQDDFSITKGILALSMATVALWLIIPRGFYFISKWKKDQNQLSFSAGIFCFFISILILISVGAWIEKKLIIFLIFFNLKYSKLIFFLLTSYFLLYISIPKTLVFFKKWQATEKSKYVSLSALFTFASIFFMYVISNLFFSAFIR